MALQSLDEMYQEIEILLSELPRTPQAQRERDISLMVKLMTSFRNEALRCVSGWQAVPKILRDQYQDSVAAEAVEEVVRYFKRHRVVVSEEQELGALSDLTMFKLRTTLGLSSGIWLRVKSLDKECCAALTWRDGTGFDRSEVTYIPQSQKVQPVLSFG